MRLLSISLFLVTLGLFSFGAACSSTVAGLEDVVYEGGASDEALDTMLALPAKAAPSPLVFEKPAANAQVSAATPPAFAWTDAASPRTGLRSAPRSGPCLAGFTGLMSHTGRTAPTWRASRLFGGGEAYAHGAALNGKAHLVTFSSGANPQAVRVFTTLTTYTPTPTVWQKLSAEKGPITAKLQTATFDNNAVVTGPFDGGSVVFTVTP